MGRFAPTAALILATLIALSPTSPARAADRRAEARAHYDSAKRAFQDGKYDEAAREFSAAYDLAGEAPILYNVAQAYRNAQRFEKASEAYRTFLKKMGADLPNRAEIEGRIVEMDERAADERRRAERARQDAASPRRHAQDVETTNPPQGGNNPERPVAAGQPGWTLEIIGYSLLGLAGATLATGIALSVESTSLSHDVQRAANAPQHGMFTSALHEDQTRGHIFDKVGIAMYVTAGLSVVGAGVTIGLGKQQDRVWQQEHALRIVPAVGPGAAALALSGRF